MRNSIFPFSEQRTVNKTSVPFSGQVWPFGPDETAKAAEGGNRGFCLWTLLSSYIQFCDRLFISVAVVVDQAACLNDLTLLGGHIGNVQV